jgi:DNA-binding SARP family transcriptional activator
MIRAHGFVPETPGEKDWPWIVKIYTLGRFRLEIHSVEIGQSQFQGKPHALLSALISLGNKEVKVERIAELLWPDAEGDAALSAFTTTLSRLRKLIGDEIIVVQGGRVSLDERQCWLDVRALEHYIRQVDEADKSDTAALREWAEEVFCLYKGPYMQNEKWEWVEPLRQRLREELVRVMEQCDGLLRKRPARQTTCLLKRLIKVDQAVHSIK